MSAGQQQQQQQQQQQEEEAPSASKCEFTANDDDDDESLKLAAQLQAEFDAELAQHQKKGELSQCAETNDSSLMAELLRAQAELDAEMAMKMQDSEYGGHSHSQSKWANTGGGASGGAHQSASNFSLQKPDADRVTPTGEAIGRLTADLKECFLSGAEMGIHVYPDDNDITHISVLLVGPSETPYAGGFFHFDMLFPHDYPWRPPKVQIVTTDSGRCRFNPNLYSNGKVCLSILGTWSGPGWSSVQTMRSTLLSILSLMHSKPYHNEPGFEQERVTGDVQKYNDIIAHETIRVAVIGMIRNPTCGDKFQDEIREHYLAHVQDYINACEAHATLARCKDGKRMSDPFGEQRGVFRWTDMIAELRELEQELADPRGTEHVVSTTEMPVVAEDAPGESAWLQPAADAHEAPPTPPDIASLSQQLMNSSAFQNFGVIEDNFNPPNQETLGLAQALAMSLSAYYTTATDKQVPGVFHADAELATKLQKEFYAGATAGKVCNSGYGENAPPSAVRATLNIEALRQLQSSAASNPQKENDDDGPTCLVCHTSPVEFIVPPACDGLHVYCLSCADRLIRKLDDVAAAVRENFTYALDDIIQHMHAKESGTNLDPVTFMPGASVEPVSLSTSGAETKVPASSESVECGSESVALTTIKLLANSLPAPKHYLKCVLCDKISTLEAAGVVAPTVSEASDDLGRRRDGNRYGRSSSMRGRRNRSRPPDGGSRSSPNAQAVLHALRRKRRRISMTNEASAGIVQTCPSHPGEALDVYCTHCQLLLCFSCAGAHDKAPHALEPLADACKFGEDFLRSNLASLNGRLEEFERVQSQMWSKRDCIASNAAAIERTVHDSFAAIRKALAAREAAVVESVHRLAKEREREMGRQLEKITSTLDVFRAAAQEGSSLLQSRVDAQCSPGDGDGRDDAECSSRVFLARLEAVEEGIRRGAEVVPPSINKRVYELPSITQTARQALASVKRLMPYGDKQLDPPALQFGGMLDPGAMFSGADETYCDDSGSEIEVDAGIAEDDDELLVVLDDALHSGLVPPHVIRLIRDFASKTHHKAADGSASASAAPTASGTVSETPEYSSGGATDLVSDWFLQQLESAAERDSHAPHWDF